MKVQRGDVVLVDYPFSDGSGSNVRPIVVAQADQWNARLDDTILAVVTSSARRRVTTPPQFLVEVATIEGQQSGLRADSVIQCGNLATYAQDRIIRVMGRLAASYLDQLDECLLAALGLQ
jgi:mRNA interferase MazF